MALINPNTQSAPPIKPAINVGACLDVITGSYVQGARGEHILNGGAAFVMGTVGIGNSFKSTFMRYMSSVAMGRMSLESAKETFDTETNVNEDQLHNHYSRIRELEGENIILTGRWKIIDGRVMAGNEWYKEHKLFLQSKVKNKDNLLVSPFLDRDRKSHMKMIIPTFTHIDSFSEFKTEDVEEMNDKHELGNSGANTMHMRQGLSKLRVLMDAPSLCGGTYDYLFMTAHIGKEMTMQNAGPGGQVPIVKLKHLKNGDKIKGTTDKFTFITHSCWHCYDAGPFLKDKYVVYPRNKFDNIELDTDLNKVKIRNLRCKSGPSGMSLELMISQSEGVLPSLTEYHYVKTNGNDFGFEGNATTFSLSLYPKTKLMRTTARELLEYSDDDKLRRAMNITSEMLQIKQLWWHAKPYLCTPKQLREDLIAMGYDWDVLLTTRGWWTTLENEYRFDPFLSTWDLLLMRTGEYIPFWFTPEQRKAIDLTKAKPLDGVAIDPAVVEQVGKIIVDARKAVREVEPDYV